jgi:hypothetical protein
MMFVRQEQQRQVITNIGNKGKVKAKSNTQIINDT